MCRINHLAEYLLVLEVTTQISWIYCRSGEENANKGLSHEANIEFNLNEMNTSYNTIENFAPDENMLAKPSGKEISPKEENKHVFSNYYNDLNHMCKRNTYAHRRMGKKKQFIKHKKPSQVKISRTYPFRRKSKDGQSKTKHDKVKKYEYEGTSMYENNKSPFKDNTSKYNPKFDVDIIYKNLKATDESNENTSNIFPEFDSKKETTFNDDNIPTSKEDKDKNGNSKGDNVNTSARESKENNIALIKTEEIDTEHEEKANNHETQEESTGSLENSGEYSKKEYGHKSKRKGLNKQTDIDSNGEDTESNNQESKPSISNNSKIKPSVHCLSKAPSLLSLPSQNHEQTSLTQDGEGSDNVESYKRYNDLVRNGGHAKLDDKCSEKGNVLESKKYLKKVTHIDDFDVMGTPNDKIYSTYDKETMNKSEQKKHKIIHSNAHNVKYSAENSFQNSNHKFQDSEQNERPKKNASPKLRRDLTPASEREYYENSDKETSLDDSSLDLEKHINRLEDLNSIANKRNEREIKKRLTKHNKYKKHNMMQDGNVFGYMKNSDEDENSNAMKLNSAHKGENIYSSTYDDNSEQQNRPIDVYSNNNDKYSYKESFEEDSEVVNDDDHTNNKYNRKNTLSRQSHESTQKGESKEKCVEYKAEKTTKKPTITTVCSTEKFTTKGTTCGNKRATVKTKTTTQTCNKSATTKNMESENVKNNSNSVLDVFEKYLCGQLVDDFVDAVMNKVKRSRKIYKELGFRNDSEETCDRCIETKPNKIPDKESMKSALGKCWKNEEHKPNCYMCYSVPRPMEKMLKLLVLFEKEHENNVYNKIRDDSSFIFTGDYPEQFNANDNSIDNKYTSNRDSLSKGTFEKQDLREDSNEEMQYDQVANKNALEDEYTTLEADKQNVEHSTETGVNQNENTGKTYTKVNVQNDKANEDLNNKNKGKSSLVLDDKMEENDFNNEVDMNVARRSKYSFMKGPETDELDDSFDRASIKERRKAFKSDKPLSPTNAYIAPKDLGAEAASDMKKHHLGEHNLGFVDNSPTKDRYDYNPRVIVPKERDNYNTYENVRQSHDTPDYHIGIRPYSDNNRISALDYPSNKNYERNHFSYPSDDYSDGGEFPHTQSNNRHPVVDGFISTGWDGKAFKLLPKQSDREYSKNSMLDPVARKKYFTDYEDRLNMVKRESEPSYEDEPLLFEIPNIEYDLY